MTDKATEDFKFVADCFDGKHGREYKILASGVLRDAEDRGYLDDSTRVADALRAAVQDCADTIRASARD